jgi:hypothetical protein
MRIRVAWTEMGDEIHITFSIFVFQIHPRARFYRPSRDQIESGDDNQSTTTTNHETAFVVFSFQGSNFEEAFKP